MNNPFADMARTHLREQRQESMREHAEMVGDFRQSLLAQGIPIGEVRNLVRDYHNFRLMAAFGCLPKPPGQP